MGVDISISMGWGIHFSQQEIDDWVGSEDEAWDSLELLVSQNRELTYAYAGNSWAGEDNGFVVYAYPVFQEFDMGRSAEAGVYREPTERLSLPAQYQLNEVSKTITGKHLPIEWLVTVGVS